MKPARPTTPRPQRCAVYTRKSTDHNLDLAFNSLDAQREACEAYVKSQAHEGWTLIPDRFDDGAFSGASLDRPALAALLDMVRAEKIDIIVVYKVDRLTRSLADFAKLVELFDAHGVSFVSVTQSFNTTSSMGRLTLNVLLSFAQFEREVIGERVRDKISASKRKGIWVGGPVPLGYRSVAKKLEIASENAELVRKVFADYLALGSIGELVATLDREGIRPKARVLSSGRALAPERFGVGGLAYILRNRMYVGEVAYRGEVHKGEHPPIVDRAVFDAVQQALGERAVDRKVSRTDTGSLLAGLLFDDRGNAMSPSHANKRGVRYRYYVSQALLQHRKHEAGSVFRVSAPDVERAVLKALQGEFKGDENISDRDLVETHVIRVMVTHGSITIEPRESPANLSDKISVPFFPASTARKGVLHSPGAATTVDADTRDTLLRAVARARRWMEAAASGEISSLSEIARDNNLDERYVRRLATLANLSPRIVQAIVDGTAPASLTVSGLTLSPPLSWAAQEAVFLSN